MHIEGEDGWTVIATGKKHILSGNRKKNKTVLAVSQVPYDWTALANHEESLQKSQTVAIASQLLSDLLDKFRMKQQKLAVHVEALGLGDINLQKKPRLQFYLLKSLLRTAVMQCNRVTANIYDPVFNEDCRMMLKQLPVEATSHPFEPECHQQTHVTIYFMPHCEKQLYEHVILHSFTPYAIFGNSLDCYHERELMLGQPHTAVFHNTTFQEVVLPDYQSAFNDTYFTTSI